MKNLITGFPICQLLLIEYLEENEIRPLSKELMFIIQTQLERSHVKCDF